MAARAGVDPTTLRLEAIDSTNEPPRPTYMHTCIYLSMHIAYAYTTDKRTFIFSFNFFFFYGSEPFRQVRASKLAITCALMYTSIIYIVTLRLFADLIQDCLLNVRLYII